MAAFLDETIRINALAELRDEPSVDAAHIAVRVHHGVVTLSGRVSLNAEKVAAEEAVWHVGGVCAIADELEVHLREEHYRTDEEIALAAVDVLRWNSVVPGDRIQVLVEKARVTLQGTVCWRYQKTEAELAIRSLVGVKALINLILVEPQVPMKPGAVKQRVCEALKRNAALEARRIGVDVNSSGEIKLHGSVHSWAELRAAEHAAWSAPGVNRVNCELHVVSA